MDARYKIYFSGEFKDWVKREEFIQALSKHLNVSEEKSAALFEVERKVILKKNLPELEADRHMAAFQKMGMLVSKKLMMKPFVGPRIDFESRIGSVDSAKNSLSDIGASYQDKKSLSNLTNGLRSLVNKDSV